MYNLEIEGKNYQLDQEWTVETWLQLHKFDFAMEFMWPKIIEIASGAPADLVAKIGEDLQIEAIAIINANMVPNWAQLKTKMDGHSLINFDDLTIGQFVDLEVALGRGLETNLDWLIAILYKCDREEILKWNYETAFAALQTWYVTRKNLLESYEDLFETSEVEEDSRAIKVDPANNWYDILMVLANENFLDIHKVVDRPVKEALNFLVYKKDQAKKAELEQKKLEMQYKR